MLDKLAIAFVATVAALMANLAWADQDGMPDTSPGSSRPMELQIPTTKGLENVGSPEHLTNIAYALGLPDVGVRATSTKLTRMGITLREYMDESLGYSMSIRAGVQGVRAFNPAVELRLRW